MKKNSNHFVLSKCFEPWFNLAVEEYLTANINPGQVILYLWQNSNTVVIGSNQNPWKECDVDKIREKKVKLARRLSGGGAVYHDMGNLNFTFIAENDLFDIEKNLNVIINAVNSFGLKAEFSGRNDILINNKKFSGNAYYNGDNASYHHGTILIDSDLSRLEEFLTPSKQKINSKGIESVKSRVCSLKELSEKISVKDMKDKIVKSFIEQYGKIENITELDEGFFKTDDFKKIHKKYASWNWIYGESPSFEAVHSRRYRWGEIEIGLNLTDGYITDLRIYTDSLVTTFIKKLSKALYGVRYESDDIKKAIDSIEPSDRETEIFSNISEMFERRCACEKV